MTLPPSLPIPSITQPPTERATTLLRLLEASSQGDYIGESISQLEHSLQCAQQAAQHDSPATTIAGALFHDIGQFIPWELLRLSSPRSSSAVAEEETAVGRPNHASSGALYLASLGFPEAVCSVVRQHVNAKKYLCAADRGYHAGLSEASKASLRQQGGAMTESERKEWERGTVGWEDCLKVRKWDDGTKVVGVEERTPRAMAYIEVVAGCLR